MIKAITSKENQKIKYACSLKENKYRKEFHQFLGETKKSLEMAISSNLVTDVFTLEYLHIDENINQFLVSEDVLKKISSDVNPEVVFIANIPTFENKDFNKILYLDHINDPGNMGTLIRTALAFNFDAVVVSEGSVAIYNEKVISATKGAIYKIPVFVDNLSNYKSNHQIIVSSLSNDSQDIEEIKPQSSFVLVLGNEAHGVSNETIALADIIVKIPISGIDSLNVSIAGGILIYKLSK